VGVVFHTSSLPRIPLISVGIGINILDFVEEKTDRNRYLFHASYMNGCLERAAGFPPNVNVQTNAGQLTDSLVKAIGGQQKWIRQTGDVCLVATAGSWRST
jgi:hypothetical protein